MSTINKMPIPEPNTFNTSDTDARRPIIIPPTIVTEGIYLLSKTSTEPSERLNPGTWTSASSKFFAADLADNHLARPIAFQKLLLWS